MPRTTGRRPDQSSRRRDEEYGRDEAGPKPEQGKQENGSQRGSQSVDSVVADLAKSFIDAQAKTGMSSGNSNQEMLHLLERISRQLETMQRPPGNGSQGDQQIQQQGGQQNQQQGGQYNQQQGGQQNQQQGGQQNQQQGGQQILQQGGQQGGQNIAAGAGSQGQDNQQKELATVISQLLKGEKADTKVAPGRAQDNRPQQNSGRTGESDTAQTAAQVLAQAQYELANELDASLKKLKQVISESEKLADKIGNLLGQETGSRQT